MSKKTLASKLAGMAISAVLVGVLSYKTANLNEYKFNKHDHNFREISFPTGKLDSKLDKKLQISLIKNNFIRTRDNKERNFIINDFSKDNQYLLLARMLFSETVEDCPYEEFISIAYTALNRLGFGYGKNLKKVILKRGSYSCFLYKGRRIEMMNPEKYNPEKFDKCLEVAIGVLEGIYKDPTNGATHYINPKALKKIPSWPEDMVRVDIKDAVHEFYMTKSEYNSRNIKI